jgi:hypothetical protein
MHVGWRRLIVSAVLSATVGTPLLAADFACVQNPDSDCVFRLALQEAEEQERQWFGAGGPLRTVAVHQAQAGRIDDALATVAKMHEREPKRASTLTTIAVVAVEQGDLARAQDIVQRIAKAHQREFAARDIAVTQARLGDIAGAFETVATIDWKPVRKMALEEIAVEQARAGYRDAARVTFDLAMDLVESDLWLAALGERMVEAGEIEWAIELQPRFESDREWWPHLLLKIAPAYAYAGRIQEALAAAARIEIPKLRAGAMVEIATALARAGRTDEALAIADEMRVQYGRQESSLARLAVATVLAGKPREALEIARGLTSPAQISRVQSAIGTQQALHGQIQHASDIAERLPVPLHRALLMMDIALAEAHAGDESAAVRRALQIESAGWRVEALAKIALLLASQEPLRESPN